MIVVTLMFMSIPEMIILEKLHDYLVAMPWMLVTRQ